MTRAIALMLTGAVCALGGALLSGNLGAQASRPVAHAAISDAQIRRAIQNTAVNTAEIKWRLDDLLCVVGPKTADVKCGGPTDTIQYLLKRIEEHTRVPAG